MDWARECIEEIPVQTMWRGRVIGNWHCDAEITGSVDLETEVMLSRSSVGRPELFLVVLFACSVDRL
jgi:hypothetical protein